MCIRDSIKGTNQIESEHPYPAIVGINEKAAILHYRRKRSDVKNGKLLLLDAGAKVHGYSSDITRTTITDDAPEELRELHKKMEKLQLDLCGEVKADIACREYLYKSQKAVSQILLDMGFLQNTTPEEAVDKRYLRCFYPHGLSHMLGIQTHDVAGKQPSRFAENNLQKASGGIQNRNQRILGENNIITIEPGVYFNPVLMEPMRSNATNFNWSLIDKLMPYGGIRIEDNVVVKTQNSENLTRPYLPK